MRVITRNLILGEHGCGGRVITRNLILGDLGCGGDINSTRLAIQLEKWLVCLRMPSRRRN